MINVTKSFLPPISEYTSKLEQLWQTGWLTNNGKFVKELEERIKSKTGLENFLFCSNGTIVIELAMRSMQLTGEIITTPYSYVATTNAILWENCSPVFVDINDSDFNINVDLIESAITKSTSAILATHVYGNPCDVTSIERIAKKYNLKVIYDAAHAFGVEYHNKSLLKFGDIATCSFHATKVFHTVEGGGLCVNESKWFDTLYKSRQFGHIYDEYFIPGINAKNSEFHAIMGHCVLDHFDEIVAERKKISEWYNDSIIQTKIKRPLPLEGTKYNYAYYPVVFESEAVCLKVKAALESENIFPRRYFYPSLNNLPFVNYSSCPVSEKVSVAVLSLPLFYGLEKETVLKISNIINQNL